MSNPFLPDDYSVPNSSDGYMKLKQGENRIRVLSSAVIGTEIWNESEGKRTPTRFKFGQSIPNEKLGSDPKHFWAFVVWNYGEKKIQILSITQKGIMKSLRSITKGNSWGDPKAYDIVITREGEGMETEYPSIIPQPKSELDPKITELYNSSKINLEALFTGEDPFASTPKDPDLDEIEKGIDEIFT